MYTPNVVLARESIPNVDPLALPQLALLGWLSSRPFLAAASTLVPRSTLWQRDLSA